MQRITYEFLFSEELCEHIANGSSQKRRCRREFSQKNISQKITDSTSACNFNKRNTRPWVIFTFSMFFWGFFVFFPTLPKRAHIAATVSMVAPYAFWPGPDAVFLLKILKQNLHKTTIVISNNFQCNFCNNFM